MSVQVLAFSVPYQPVTCNIIVPLSYLLTGIGFPPDLCQKLGQVRLQLPEDINVGFFANQIILSLRSPWKVKNQPEFVAGSLLAASITDVMNDPSSGECSTL